MFQFWHFHEVNFALKNSAKSQCFKKNHWIWSNNSAKSGWLGILWYFFGRFWIIFKHCVLGYGLNVETGTFTAPVSGVYFMSFAAPKYKQGVIHIIVSRNGRQEFRIREYDSSNYQDNIQWSWMMNLQAYDQVTLNAPNGSIFCSDSIRITFSGFLIKRYEE